MFPAPLGARDILNNISLNTPSFHNDQRLLLSIRHRNQTFIFIILNKIGTDTHAASSFILFYFVCEIPHSCDLKNGINPFVMLYRHFVVRLALQCAERGFTVSNTTKHPGKERAGSGHTGQTTLLRR